MRGIPDVFFNLRSLDGWQQLAAEVTKYYGWGPRDAWSLTRTRLDFWADQARRINKAKAGK
ncbi:Uncharacterised protein [Serratia proteamaculans]|nr:Uncharacterised protein [Serratia proteamaculans]